MIINSSTAREPQFCSHAVSVKASFGQDSSPLLPRDIRCNGDELTLSNCTFTDYDPKGCQQVAGVICEGLFDITSS